MRRHGDRQGSRDGWVRRQGGRKTSRCETGEVTEGQTGGLEDGVKGTREETKTRRARRQVKERQGKKSQRRRDRQLSILSCFCDGH